MNHKQQLFAHAYIRYRDALIAYSKAYKPKDGSKYRSIMSAANRLLRKPEIAEYISSVCDGARAQAEYELKEQMKEELLSVHDKRLYIKRVINGEIFIPYDYKAKGCNLCTVLLRPTFPQILGYLKEDSRLAGHYPDKQKTSTRQQRTTNNTCPPLAGVSRSDGGGTLVQDPRAEQQTTTPGCSEVVARTEKDYNMATNNTCPPLAGVSRSDGGGTLVQGPREELPATSNIERTTSHAGLQKLWNKQRQRAGKLATKQGKLTGI